MVFGSKHHGKRRDLRPPGRKVVPTAQTMARCTGSVGLALQTSQKRTASLRPKRGARQGIHMQMLDVAAPPQRTRSAWVFRHAIRLLAILLLLWGNHALANSNWCASYQVKAKACADIQGQLETSPYIDYLTQSCQTTVNLDRVSGTFSVYYVAGGVSHGYKWDWWCPKTSLPPPAKDIGKPHCGACVGDPIQGRTGNVFATETDVEPQGRLGFRRYYNSDASVQDVRLGPHWTHTYARRIRYSPGNGGTLLPTAVLVEDDGRELTYQLNSGTWSGEADVSEELTSQPDANGQIAGWTVRRVNSRSVETYGADGVLLSTTDENGQATSLTYEPVPSGQGSGRRLTTAIDPFGRSIHLAYDSVGRLASITDATNATSGLQYDADGQLSGVTFPDGSTRSYLYNESGHVAGSAPNRPLLTGVIDENGQRAATYDYDASGRGISTRRANDVDRYDISFKSDGSTDVTHPLGQVRNQTFSVNSGSTYANTLSGPCAGCGNIAARSYDIFGNLNQSTDFNGVVTNYTYDVNRLLTSKVEAVGRSEQKTTQTDWNDQFRPIATRIYDAKYKLVSRTSFAYDAAGRLTASCLIDPAVVRTYVCSASDVPPAGVRRTVNTYCESVDGANCPVVGLLLSTDGPRVDVADTVSSVYYQTTDESGCATLGGACHHAGDLRSTTDGAGLVTAYVSYDRAGRVSRVADANGVLTDYTYTPRGWLATTTIRANASGTPSSGDAVTTIAYDPTGTVHSVTDPDGVMTTYTYDAAGRLTDITDAVGNRIHYTLDAAGNKAAEQVLSPTGVVVRSLGRMFNSLGQLTAITDGLNRTVFAASFADSYDGNGNLVHSQDGLAVQQKQVYDGLNRLVSTIRDYQGTNAATANTQSVTAYDALDRVAGFSDPDGLNTTYDFDGLGNATGLHSPDTGTTTRKYDTAGNPTSSVDAANVATASTFDALNRLTATTYPDTSLNVAYKYDEDDSITSSGNAGKGRLTRIVEGNGGIAYCYDRRGNVIRKQQTVGTTTSTTAYSWTLGGRLKSVTTANGTSVAYARDADGRIITVTATPTNGSATAVASNVTYQPFGPVASYTLGNGQIVTRGYDANGRPTDVESPAFALHVARDVMGNVTAIGDASGASPATETYGYDALYRLTGLSAANDGNDEAYTYNKTGDRLSKSAPGLLTGNYTYAAGTHHLTGVGTTTRQVDARGNTTAEVLASGLLGFGYNQRNRLTVVQSNGATVGTYYLNALGERVQKVAAGSTTRFDYDEASRLLSESSVATARDYIWLDDLAIGVIDGGGTATTINYVHADMLGTPRAIADSTGSIRWQWPYANNPFGEKAPVTTTGYTFNLRFPGQYADNESNLNYNRHRDYEPAAGRYIQSDPLGLSGGENAYSYVVSDPLDSIDPSGLVKWNVGIFSIGGKIPRLKIPLGGGTFTAMSECVNGQQGFADGTIAFSDQGIGFPLGFSGTNTTLDDGLPFVDPKSLQGVYISLGVQALFGSGPSFSSTRMGRGRSGFGWSFDGGLGAGTSAAFGRTNILHSGLIKCGCSEN